MNMANSIKQLANLLISFIDKTFLPLFDFKIPEAAKALDQWNQVKNFLQQGQQIQIPKFEKFLVDMPMRITNVQQYKINSPQNNKTGSNIKSMGYFDNDLWKYRNGERDSVHLLQPEKKDNYNINPLPIDNMKQDQKIDTRNIDYFESLLSSFKKLCTNFQNNHKKLIMDRQSFSH